jgi:hypothetical protein
MGLTATGDQRLRVSGDDRLAKTTRELDPERLDLDADQLSMVNA